MIMKHIGYHTLISLIVFVGYSLSQNCSTTENFESTVNKSCCNDQGVKIFEANLTSGATYISTATSAVVTWLKALEASPGNGMCNLQGVVRINFPPPINCKQNCRLKFDLHMLKDLSHGNGWNFDIGDSTNDGYGGDAGHTSNSAEVHNYRGNFMVYSNTLPGYAEYSKNVSLVDQQEDVMTNNVTITVGNQFVQFDNRRGIQRSYSSPYLFTLNGQPTTYGSPNYDIYFSMNRVIYPWQFDTIRSGIGLCNAVIRAIGYGPPQPTVNEKLNIIAMMNISSENVDSVIKICADIILSINQTSDQNAENLKVVANVLTLSAEVIQTGNISLEIIKNVTANAAKILDSVEEWPTDIVEQHSNKIVKAFDSIVYALIQQKNFTNISVVQRDLALKGERVERAMFHGRTMRVRRTDIATSDGLLMEELKHTENSKIYLPEEVASTATAEQHVALAFIVYNNPALFPVRNSTTVVGSQVVSATVNGIKNGMILANKSLVTFSLRLTNMPNLEEDEFITNRRCVFWDFTGEGNWSSYGCSLVSFNHSTNVVKCECNHLTNFALLVDISIRLSTEKPVIPDEFKLALEITSYTGVALSLAGLTIFLLTHLIFRKFRQRDVAKFHVQLAVSMLLMLIVFVAGIGRTENRIGCITVGVLLHYLILVTWMWMGAEAVLLFQKLIIVFKKITTRQLVFITFLCWAVPLIPVVISVGTDPNHYVTQFNTSSEDFCFIGDTAVFFGAFIGPIILVIIANVCVTVCVGYVIIKHRLKQQELKQASSVKKQRMSSKQICKLLVSLVGFMILLGLSWVILLFTVVGADTDIYAAFAIQWLFVFFNSLQGLFIFIFFVVINADVRNEWKILLTAPLFKSTQYSFRYNQIISRSTTTGKPSRETKEVVCHLNEAEKSFEDTSVHIYDEPLTSCEDPYIVMQPANRHAMKPEYSNTKEKTKMNTVL